MTSLVKRRKIRAQELTDLTENLRQSLPNLNNREIRRHRIPYHEALCLELDEDGYEISANFVRDLIEFQDIFRLKAGQDSLTWLKPVLKEHRPAIHVLCEKLREAEDGKKNYQVGVECDHLLQLGVYFAVRADSWSWLAEQILRESVNIASTFCEDGGERHAMCRYIFGRFLLTELADAEHAKDQLIICRDLCAGKKWSAKTMLQIPQDNLFKECCSLLYKSLLILAKIVLPTNPKHALRMCSIAQKRAVDAEDSAGEMDCLMQLGLCEMELGDSASAKKIFNKMLITNFSLNNLVGVCDARVQLALANANLGNIQEAFYHLNLLLDFTQKHELRYYYGECLRFLGEMHMYHRKPKDATPFLSLALEVFHELDEYEKREQVKNLACISRGLEFCVAYRNLLEHCENNPNKQKYLNRLIDWKDSRNPFWFESDIQICDALVSNLGGEDMMDFGEMITPPHYEYSDVYTEDSQNVSLVDPDTAVVLEVPDN